MNTFKVRDKETGKVFTVRQKSDSTQESVIQDVSKEQQTPFNAPMKERGISFMTGGVAPAAGGARNAEKVAVPVSAGIGGILGAQVGHPNLGAGVGATVGKLYQDTVNKVFRGGEDIDVRDAVVMGGMYSAGGKVFDTALKSVGLAGKLIPEKTREIFFNKALQAVNIGRKALTRNWARSVNQLMEKNPNVTVDMSRVVMRLKDQLKMMDETLIPQLKTAVKRSPSLAKAVEDPSLAMNLTLREAQELKNAVTSTTNAITARSIKGKTTPNERLVFDLLDEFDDAIISKFPEMVKVKQVYSQGKHDFNLARPLVEAGTAVEGSIFSKPQGLFGAGGTPFMKSTQGKLAFKRIVSQTKAGEKMFKAAELAYKLNRAADFIARMSQLAVGGSAASMLFGGNRKTD